MTQRLSTFVSALAAAAPGSLTSVVVTGSAAAGDWWPGTSDIDVVFVVSRAFSGTEVEVVARLHAATIPLGCIDGLYLTSEQLAAGPEALRSASQAVEGVFREDVQGAQLTWITWREVEEGIEATVKGSGELGPWVRSVRRFEGAERRSREFSRQNLHDYWSPLVDRVGEQLADQPDDAEVDARTLEWIVFGPPRLAATIETGLILTKTAAARYAAERWPTYARLLERAIASRSGEAEVFTTRDARDAAKLARELIGAYPMNAKQRWRSE